MQSPTERKKAMRYLVAAATFLAAALGLTTVAPAQESTQYSGVAAGDGVRIRFHVPDFLVVEDFVDAGAPTAQAGIDGIGGSNGFASAPYPGQTVVTGGGTFAIATGIQLPGAYPWYTATAYPATPEKKVDQGPVFLESTSGAQSSHSAARLGAPDGSGRTASDARVSRADDGAVTAAAETFADLVKVGPVSVSGLVSKATVVRRPGHEPERSSSLRAAAITIADTPVTIGPEGLVLAGTAIPAQGIPGIKEALASAHVTVETVQVSQTDDGVVAPGLRITTTQDIPGAGVPGTVTYTLGQAFAAATAGGVPPIGLGTGDTSAGGVGVDPGSADDASGASPPAVSSGFASPGSSGGAGPLGSEAGAGSAGPSSSALMRGTGGLVPGGGGTAPVDAANASANGDAGASGLAPAPHVRAGNDLAAIGTTKPAATVATWSLFPILLIAGALVALGAYGQRLMRVRKSWSS
jgi:hypothetical protein